MKNRIIALVVGIILLLVSSLTAQGPDIEELEVSNIGGGKSTPLALSLSIASTIMYPKNWTGICIDLRWKLGMGSGTI
jgi:hypothetical protein